MKLALKRTLAAGGTIVCFVSIRKMLSGEQLWRMRRSRELWVMLHDMLEDIPAEQIEMALIVCQVGHYDVSADWQRVGRDQYAQPQPFYSEALPQLVEWERKRQIYDRVADLFAAIGSYSNYGYCRAYANELDEKITSACAKARFSGYPLDGLLQSLR